MFRIIKIFTAIQTNCLHCSDNTINVTQTQYAASENTMFRIIKIFTALKTNCFHCSDITINVTQTQYNIQCYQQQHIVRNNQNIHKLTQIHEYCDQFPLLYLTIISISHHTTCHAETMAHWQKHEVQITQSNNSLKKKT